MATMFVNLNGKHLCRSDGACHSDRKKSDRATSGNRNCFRRDLPSQDRVNRIPQWIQNRCILLRNRRIQLPDVRFRNHDELSESAIRIDTDDFYVLANVGLAGTALEALATGHMHLSGNEVTFFDTGDLVSKRNNFSAKFVPGD